MLPFKWPRNRIPTASSTCCRNIQTENYHFKKTLNNSIYVRFHTKCIICAPHHHKVREYVLENSKLRHNIEFSMYTVPLKQLSTHTHTGVTNQAHDTGHTKCCRVWLFVLSNMSTEVFRTCQWTWILMVLCRLFFC